MHAVMLVAALLAADYPPVAVVGWGQSNWIGNTSTPARTTTQPGNSCRWSGNVLNGTFMDIDTSTPDNCVPLMEATYEMPRTAMAARYVALTGAKGMFVANMAQGGANYTLIKSGTTQWNKMVTMVSAYGSRNSVGGRFLGFVVHHGEQDDNNGITRAAYKAFMVELQGDATVVLRRVSFPRNPTAEFPVYHTQFSKFAAYGRTGTTVAMAQLELANENPGKHVLVGPKYQYTYLDAVHLDAPGYERMASKVGQVLAVGPSWRPTTITGVTRYGTTLRVCYNVPFPPLALDTTFASNAGNYGLQYVCSAGAPAIASVATFGADCIDVRLAEEPSLTCQDDDRITYAFDGNVSGRGNIRDADPEGLIHASRYNWAVHEEEYVP